MCKTIIDNAIDCFFVKKEDFIDHLPKLSLNFSKISGKKRLK